MGVADLVILIKWFLVGAAILFVLGGILMIYLKNFEYAAKAAEKQAKKSEDDAELAAKSTEKTDVKILEGTGEVDNDENSGNKSQDS